MSGLETKRIGAEMLRMSKDSDFINVSGFAESGRRLVCIYIKVCCNGSCI